MDYIFGMLPERFESVEEAKEFLKNKEVPELLMQMTGPNNLDDFSSTISEETDVYMQAILRRDNEDRVIIEYIVELV